MNPTVEAAQSYAERGWPVFRLCHGLKQPLDRWVNGGPSEAATTNKDEIARRWHGFPERYIPGVGIATGYEACDGCFLTVVDLDIDEDDYAGRPDWAKPTHEVQTASGGWHLYYYTAEPMKSGRYAPGIDVKSRGGFVVAPPSRVGRIHYQTVRCQTPVFLAVPPFYIVSDEGTSSVPYDGVRSHSQRRTTLKQPQEILPGERNTQLMANGAAIYAVAESAEAARYTIETFNAMMPEPLSAREVKNIADWLEARENWVL